MLRADGLVKHYSDGHVQALRGVSLEIAEGDFVAITGPSGCGKSTLLHLLGGLDRPTAGRGLLPGTAAVAARSRHFRARQVGFVFQSFYLMPTLTALENVQIPMFEGPWPRRERATARRRSPRRSGLVPSARPSAQPALRRRAPAGRDRPRAGQRSVAAPGRRADRQPRQQEPGRDPPIAGSAPRPVAGSRW